MDRQAKPASEASTAELLTQLSAQTSRLVRDEFRLAQKEFTNSARHAGIGAGLFSAAGLIAIFGLGALLTAAIAAVALVLPLWASALVVAAVLFVAAAVTAAVSKKQLNQATATPEQAVANVKQDVNEVKAARHDR